MSFEIRNIVSGVDFSPASIAALDVAVALAEEQGARVYAVHAYSVQPAPFVDSGVVTVDEERLARALESDLRELVASHTRPSVPIEPVVVSGLAASALLIEADRVGAELIVTGTRGLSRLPRFLLGSVAERVARTAPVPVLVVPEPDGAPGVRPIRTIVCGIDFSAQSSAAAKMAADLAASHRAALHLVHVWEPGPFLARHAGAVDEHERQLSEALTAEARAIEGVATAPACSVRRGKPYARILEDASDVGADLIVVGSTGKSGPAHFLLGSVAERVMRASHVPVLVVRH